MFRTIIWFFYFCISLLWFLPQLWKVNRLLKKGKIQAYEAEVDKNTRLWMGSLVKLGGLKLRAEGLEKIPKNEAILYVGNHQGYFDIPTCITLLPGITGFIAKKESNRFLIIRKWMQHMNCVFIDRKNPRNSVKAINTAIENLKKGKSIVVFPEGTRSKDGQLGKFKAGSMKLAIRSGVKVVPIALDGTRHAMKKGSPWIRSASAVLRVGEPMIFDPENDDSVSFSQKVKSSIASLLEIGD